MNGPKAVSAFDALADIVRERASRCDGSFVLRGEPLQLDGRFSSRKTPIVAGYGFASLWGAIADDSKIVGRGAIGTGEAEIVRECLLGAMHDTLKSLEPAFNAMLSQRLVERRAELIEGFEALAKGNIEELGKLREGEK